jgi:beta-glucosidase
MSFPTNFTWGVAAASYQIEGAWNKDGKGLSVWDMLTRQPGKIWEGHIGDTACDHYHRYQEDINSMREIGVNAYRLSISWPRVIPAGAGAVNNKGLGFYDSLIDELLAKEIEPWITLFHWDYPYELFLRGGWLNPDSPKWFSDYVEVVVDRLSDRVDRWITLNEPQCFLHLGHSVGEHAPGLKLGLHEVLLATHHTLLAHGLGVQAIRARAKKKPNVGWAPVGWFCYPVSDKPEDIEASRQATMQVKDGWNTCWYADPVILGRYPEDGLKTFGDAVPKFPASDLETMRQPLDFYGFNSYTGVPTQAGPDGSPVHPKLPAGHGHTLFLWKVTPEILHWGPKFMAERYKLPVVITENGMSNSDWVALDGRVHDGPRIDYLWRHLRALHKAINEGTDVRGYFHWSFIDNFEWAEGYKHRFGLIHCDFETQKRTLKDSAYWYREVVQTNGGSLGA